MSLEEALNKNTAAIEKFISLLEDGVLPGFVKSRRLETIEPVEESTAPLADSPEPVKERKKRGPNKSKDAVVSVASEIVVSSEDEAKKLHGKLVDIITVLAEAGRGQEVKDLFKEFGAERLAGIKEEDYESVLEKLNKLNDISSQSLV